MRKAKEVAHGKTKPDVFLLAAHKLGINPKECIMFEDITQAVKSAKQAGMTVYGIYDEACMEHWPQMQKIADGVLYSFKNARCRNKKCELRFNRKITKR